MGSTNTPRLFVTRKEIMKMTGIFLDIGECASARGCHGE
uniref:Uncharacterized protein n=1 Tax=Rhizobium leguminosarum bv. viciae TaxID=387 RepID=A0A0U3I5T9_RHILV|nr:hypothetical protein [Rhizobium leguminosarum bv. viciae]